MSKIESIQDLTAKRQSVILWKKEIEAIDMASNKLQRKEKVLYIYI